MDNMSKHYIELSFLGKDSVPFKSAIEIPEEIYVQFEKLIAKKQPVDKLFKAGSGDVKAFLNKAQKGITPKQLRTVVCNETLIKNLKAKTVTKDSKESDKIRAIFEANLEIARTLNHQKNISKNYNEAEDKVKERVQKSKDRLATVKAQHVDRLAKLDEKAAKYRVAFKGQKLLKEKLAEIDEAKAKLVSQMERVKGSIEKAEFALLKKQETKEISLGTSLSSYADGKVLMSYLKYIDLEPSKIFTATQLKTFAYAEGVDEKYWRNYPA
jgi:DNA topoisomerase-1